MYSEISVVVDVASPSTAAGLCALLTEGHVNARCINGMFVTAESVLLVGAARLVERPVIGLKVVAVLDAVDMQELRGVLAAGARGAILRDGPADDLLAAVTAANDGHGWFSAALCPLLGEALLGTPAVEAAAGDLAQLTGREREVLDHLVHGRSTIEVAESLHLSTKTVRLHVSGVLRKFGVTTRAAAVARVTGHWSDARPSDNPAI